MKTSPSRPFLACFLLAAVLGALLLLPGCGYLGIAGVVWRLAEPEEEADPNRAPEATSAYALGISGTGTVEIRYILSDPESDPARVILGYSLNGGSTFTEPLTELSGGSSEGCTGLAAPATGQSHLFVWNAPHDVSGYNLSVVLRVKPVDETTGRQGEAWVSAPFTLFSNGAPAATVMTPQGVLGDRIALSFVLADAEANPADVTAEYSANNGASWNPATALTGFGVEGTAGLSTSTSGTTHVFQWLSFLDLAGQDSQVIFRVTPTDAVSGATGSAAQSQPFWVYASRPHTVAGDGTRPMTGFASSAFDSRGILYVSESFGHSVWAYNPTQGTCVVAGADLNPGQLRVVAGTGASGYDGDNVPGPQASLASPAGLCLDGASPPNLFVADTGNHRVRRVDGATGYITTLCGTGVAGTADDVPAFQGQVNGPRACATDVYGNVYVADTGNHALRVVNLGSSDLYVADSVVAAGRIATVAGQLGSAGSGGDGASASLSSLDTPVDVALDSLGNLYVCDQGNDRVRAVCVTPGFLQVGAVIVPGESIETVAGGGTAAPAGAGTDPLTVQFGLLTGLLLDGGGHLYLCDGQNHALCVLNTTAATAVAFGSLLLPGGTLAPAAGTWTASGYGGDGADATLALLDGPALPAAAPGGLIAVPDTGNGCIRLYNPTFAGGPGAAFASLTVGAGFVETGVTPANPPLSQPAGLDAYGTVVYVADPVNHRILRFDAVTGRVAVAAGTGLAGSTDGALAAATFDTPRDVAVDASGTLLLVADQGNDALRLVNLGGATIAFGEAVGADEVVTLSQASGLSGPRGVALSKPSRTGDLFAADTGNHRIVRVSRADGSMTVVAGDGTAGSIATDGPIGSLRFDTPSDLAVSSDGTLLAVADTQNHAVRLVNLGASAYTVGFVTPLVVDPSEAATVAGTGVSGYNGDGLLAWTAQLASPASVEFDAFGNIFVTDPSNHRIRRVSVSSGAMTTVVGTGDAGFNGDVVPAMNTWVNGPTGVALDGNQVAYFSDTLNDRLRRFVP